MQCVKCVYLFISIKLLRAFEELSNYWELLTVGQASDSMTALTLSVNRLVGALCLAVAGPTVAQLEVFFSSD